MCPVCVECLLHVLPPKRIPHRVVRGLRLQADPFRQIPVKSTVPPKMAITSFLGGGGGGYLLHARIFLKCCFPKGEPTYPPCARGDLRTSMLTRNLTLRLRRLWPRDFSKIDFTRPVLSSFFFLIPFCVIRRHNQCSSVKSPVFVKRKLSGKVWGASPTRGAAHQRKTGGAHVARQKVKTNKAATKGQQKAKWFTHNFSAMSSKRVLGWQHHTGQATQTEPSMWFSEYWY